MATERVKVSSELIAELSEEWSRPVQMKIDCTDSDGDLELILRNEQPEAVPKSELQPILDGLKDCDLHRGGIRSDFGGENLGPSFAEVDRERFQAARDALSALLSTDSEEDG